MLKLNIEFCADSYSIGNIGDKKIVYVSASFFSNECSHPISEGIGYYSPPPIQSDSEQRKYSLSSDTAYYSPPPLAASDTERKYSVSSDAQVWTEIAT